MITRVDADGLVRSVLDLIYGSDGSGVVVDDEFTVEREYSWLFFANATGGVRTRDSREVLIGAGPMLVLRDGSGVVLFPSAYDGKRALAAYEQHPAQFPVYQL